MSKKAGLAILCVAAVAILGFIGYELYTTGFDLSKLDPRLFLVLITCGVTIVKVMSNQSNIEITPDWLNKEYADVLPKAFASDSASKKRLIQAVTLFSRGKSSDALKELNKLIPLCQGDDDLQAVHFFLAACYEEQGFPKDALEHYHETIRAYPNNLTALNNAGLILSKQGEFDSAIKYYNRAILINPKDAYPYNNLASLYIRQMKPDESIEYSKEALEHKPNMYEAMNALAIAYAMKGDRQQAEQYYQQSVVNGCPHADALHEQISRILRDTH